MFKNVLQSLLVICSSVWFVVASAQTTEIVVEYPIPELFKNVHEQLAKEFMQKYPQYKVTFLAPTNSYEEATQRTLRSALTNQLPDVSFQGLNRQRIFFDRNLAIDLSPFIQSEAKWSEMGYDAALLSLGQVRGKQVGIGFALSTPIVYFNADLVRKAGGDPNNFPKTWDGIFALAQKIKQTSPTVHGLHFDWDITGNWLWQSLVFSFGGTMTNADETKVAFNDEKGQAAMNILHRLVTEGTMRDVSSAAARQDFMSGNMGIWFHSTSNLGTATKQIGDKFELRTAAFPVPAANGRLPAGGNAVMMFAKDPAKQKAAWEYIKFVTGPVGATAMVRGTGYFPANTIPAADPTLLKKFYEENPNYLTAIKQLPILTGWYAFPGENGLKITDVIKDQLQAVLNKSSTPQDALAKMTTQVQKLLAP